eukprot:GILJ01012211.1.p1 GENE.GILJ01012211.1~~GILJ01012211.1.p1  ORF type:complete len:115 (+),score=11.81 GILJ01012211.1:162-506(+)
MSYREQRSIYEPTFGRRSMTFDAPPTLQKDYKIKIKRPIVSRGMIGLFGLVWLLSVVGLIWLIVRVDGAKSSQPVLTSVVAVSTLTSAMWIVMQVMMTAQSDLNSEELKRFQYT